MTGNSRKVILSREMVKLVLINAAANHIARSDRCLLKISSAGTHLVVHFSSCAFEMADEFIGPFPNAYHPVFQSKSYEEVCYEYQAFIWKVEIIALTKVLQQDSL